MDRVIDQDVDPPVKHIERLIPETSRRSRISQVKAIAADGPDFDIFAVESFGDRFANAARAARQENICHTGALNAVRALMLRV